MASSIIHLCVAKKLNNILKKEETPFLLGSIAPDLTKLVDEPKTFSHFLINSKKMDVPRIDKFLSLYKESLKTNDFNLGYLVHLYTDKLWFDGFIDEICFEDHIKLIDGTMVSIDLTEAKRLIYNDYTNMNGDLIKLYNLNLDTFEKTEILPKSNIKEIPIENLFLLCKKMNIIFDSSFSEKQYVFDISKINNFIDFCVVEIEKFLKETAII